MSNSPKFSHRFLWGVWLIASSCLFFTYGVASESDEDWGTPRVHLTRPDKDDDLIQTLHFKTLEVDVTRDDDNQPEVSLEGTFEEVNGAILINGRKGIEEIKPTADHKIKFSVPLTATTTSVALTSVDPYGKTKIENDAIEFKEYESFVKPQTFTLDKYLTPSVGFAYFSYSQDSNPSFSETLAIAKVACLQRLTPHLELNALAFAAPFSLSSSPSTTSASIYGGNLDIVDSLAWLRRPWKLSFALGGYYTTMSTSHGDFGYQNISGPEAEFRLKRLLEDSSVVSLYAKFGAVFGGSFLTSPSNRKLAAGVAYQLTSPWSFSVDFSDLQLNSLSNVNIDAQTTSLNVGYRFGI